MSNRGLQLCVTFAAVALLAACSVRDPLWAALFRQDEPQQSSMPATPHIPPEARVDEPPRVWATEAAGPPSTTLCPPTLGLLPVETVDEGADDWVNFLLSPSGRQIAISTRDGVALLNLADMQTRQRLSDSRDSLLFWTSETTVVLQAYGVPAVYQLDLSTGRKVEFAERWEYNGIDAATLKQPLYTGWQAAALLQVKQETLYEAVLQGGLPTAKAQDGTLLLRREDLLAQGPALVRKEHPDLLSYEEIGRLRMVALDVRSVQAIARRSPITNSYWHRILVVSGLPDAPHNLLIHVNSESHWSGYPMVENQILIDNGGIITWPEAHQDYAVADACPRPIGGGGYRYVLYRKAHDGMAPSPVGVIPYPYAYGAEMFWSPDGRFIYFKQVAGGRYSVSRVELPAS